MTLPLSGDDLVLLLSYGPEGTCFIAIAGPADDDFQGLPDAPENVLGFPGAVFDAFSCPGGTDYEVLAEPVLREWLLVADGDGEPLGWVETGPSLIEITDVRF